MGIRSAYYYALVGALGGLTGWFVSGWVLDYLSVEHPLPALTRVLVRGLIVGALMGGALSSRERTFKANWQKGLMDGLVGGAAGAVAGGVSSVVGSVLFTQFGQNVVGRIVGYLCLGVLIGTGEGLKWLKEGGFRRAIRGAVGGSIGGVAAALVLHVVAKSFSATWGDSISYVALGVLLGACISTAWVVNTLAVLTVVAAPKNKLVGVSLPLGTIGDADTLGSDPNVSLPMITDDRMLARHARIANRGRDFFISALPGQGPNRGGVLVNGNPLQGELQLRGGERIKAGESTFEFRLLADASVVKDGQGRVRPETDADRAKALFR